MEAGFPSPAEGVVTAKLCILAIGALHPGSALSSDTQRADFSQKTYFVESPSFGMRLSGLLPGDSSLGPTGKMSKVIDPARENPPTAVAKA
jgi:hypothetical protein